MTAEEWFERVPRVASLALAALLLAACGGGSTQAPPDERAARLAAARPGELLAYVKSRLARREQLRQATPGVALDAGAAPPLLVSAEAGGAPTMRSATTVQEAGVDEDDLVKTDGRTIYTLDVTGGQPAPTLTAHRRLADGGIETSATLALPAPPDAWPVTHGMVLGASGARLAVLGEAVSLLPGGDPCAAIEFCVGEPAILPAFAVRETEVQVQFVEAGEGGTLARGTSYALSGRLVGSRLIGDALIVVSTHTPVLAVEQLPPDTPQAEREAAIDALQASDLLPTLRIGDGAALPLVAETDCYLPTANASPGIEITTVSVFDLGRPDAPPTSRCIAGGTEAIYLSSASLVLATTRYDYRSEHTGDVVMIYPAEISTDLHKFALAAEGPVYRGSGAVPGHLGWDPARKPYRLSDHEGTLRVLSFTGETGWASAADATQAPASPATLTLLREDPTDGTLQPVASLPNTRRPEPIGKPGEQVYAVRFLGDRAFVVTFRQIDPLYVLDLADPADPKLAGALEAPGFSDWLFPVADGLLVGFGRDADASGRLGGVKVALFDVRDATAPTVIAERIFGTLGSSTALDASPHGLTMLRAGTTLRLALPMMLASESGQWQHGLLRFEVDTVARTLDTKPLVAAGDAAAGYGLWDERSVLIDDSVYYFAAGQLSASAW
jgi:hypothetical protein